MQTLQKFSERLQTIGEWGEKRMEYFGQLPRAWGTPKNRAAGRIRQLLLTNPLNSQLGANILPVGVAKKWKYKPPPSVL